VTAPWSIYLSDASAEVRLTTAQQVSPQQALVVAQDSYGFKATWSGTQKSALRIAGRSADYRAQATQGVQVEFRFRIEQPPTQQVRVGIRCIAPYERHPSPASSEPIKDAALCATSDGAMLDLTHSFAAAPIGVWRTLSYPLSCFTAHGADLSNLEAPFEIESAGAFSLTIAEARLVQRNGAASCDAR